MALWEKLSRDAKGAITVISIVFGLMGTAFAVGAATVRTMDAHQNLPGRMVVVESRVDTLRATAAYLMRVDSIRPGIWGNVERMAADMAETRCYVKAMYEQKEPSRECSALLNERRP